jgi:hypothetical protein
VPALMNLEQLSCVNLQCCYMIQRLLLLLLLL